jgi:hypothetical protein
VAVGATLRVVVRLRLVGGRDRFSREVAGDRGMWRVVTRLRFVAFGVLVL